MRVGFALPPPLPRLQGRALPGSSWGGVHAPGPNNPALTRRNPQRYNRESGDSPYFTMARLQSIARQARRVGSAAAPPCCSA